jgi:TRAP-type C4-dicarboxylate transport system substrate-binding protein
MLLLTPLSAFGAMTIKLGVVTKPGSAQNIVAEKFKALMEERSGGEVTVKIYHSKSIGNETEILQQIQMNTVQMGIITVGPFDTFDPIVRVRQLSLPVQEQRTGRCHPRWTSGPGNSDKP